jgi:hypothetical protein
MDAAQSKRTRNCKGNPKANHRGTQRKTFFCRRFALMSADFKSKIRNYGSFRRGRALMKDGKQTGKLATAFRVNHGKSFRLKDFDPADTQNLLTQKQTPTLLQRHVAEMAVL